MCVYDVMCSASELVGLFNKFSFDFDFCYAFVVEIRRASKCTQRLRSFKPKKKLCLSENGREALY